MEEGDEEVEGEVEYCSSRVGAVKRVRVRVV